MPCCKSLIPLYLQLVFALFALSASTTSFCSVLSGGTWRTEPKPQLYIYPSNLYMDGHLQHAGNKKPLKLNSTSVWNSWRRSWTMPNLGGKLARKDGPWIAQMMRFNVSIETWTSDRNGNIIYYIQIQTAQKELLNLDSTRLDYNVWALCYTSEISREPWDAAQKTGLMWLGVYGSLLSLNFLSKSLNVSHSFINLDTIFSLTCEICTSLEISSSCWNGMVCTCEVMVPILKAPREKMTALALGKGSPEATKMFKD